jgi:fucose permease
MRFSRLTYSLALVFLCYGAIVFAFGPCLTSMADTFAVPVGRLGLIFTLYAVGLIPAVLLNGYLSEVMGRRWLQLGTMGLMAVGCALFGAIASVGGPSSFPVALAAMVLLGYGAGGIEAVTNVLVTDDNQPSPAFALNATHAFFAIGAVLSPLAVSFLLRSGLPWQWVFFGGAALLVVLIFVLLPQRMPRAVSDPVPPLAAVGLLRSPLVLLLLAAITLYVGAEVGLSAWVSPLMETVLGTRRDLAGLSVSVFWSLMIVGRFAVGALSVRLRPAPLLLALAFGSAISSAGVAYAGTPGQCLVATGLAGLFMSGIFALVLVDASRNFPERIGSVFGIIMAGVGVGSLIVPAAMGWISEVAGMRAAMLVPAGLMAAVAVGYIGRWSR